MLNNVDTSVFKLFVLDFDRDKQGDLYVTFIKLVAVFDHYDQAVNYAWANYPDCYFYIVDPDGDVIY